MEYMEVKQSDMQPKEEKKAEVTVCDIRFRTNAKVYYLTLRS